MNALNLPEVELPWQVFRDLCTPATSWYDEAGWKARADAFLTRTASATQPLEQQEEGMGVSPPVEGPGCQPSASAAVPASSQSGIPDAEHLSEPAWCGWCGGTCRCDGEWHDKGGCQYCDGYCHGGCRDGGYWR